MESDDLTPTPPTFDTKGWMTDVNEELTNVEERLATQEQRSKLLMIGMGLCAFGVVVTGRITMQVLKMVQEVNATLKALSQIPGQAVQEARAQAAEPTVPKEDLPPLRELSDEEKQALQGMDPSIVKEPGPTP